MHVFRYRLGAEYLLVFAAALRWALFAEETSRDDAVDGLGTGEGDEGFGDFAHDACCAGAVDEGGVARVHGLCEGSGGFEVGRGGAG